MAEVSEQVVNSVVINGEKIDLGSEMSASEAQNQLEAMGFTDITKGATPVVNGQTLSFQQQNGEKGVY